MSYDADAASLWVGGDIDEATGVLFREALEEHSGGYSKDLTVELSRVDYFPSLAVGVLAAARRQANEANVALDVIASEGTTAQRVLEICGIPYRTS